MDFGMVGTVATGLLLNELIGDMTLSDTGTYTSSSSDAINIPGTIVGQLAGSATAKQYMQNFARYNNYTTCNYGAAQMAADRYMTLKERIPMSFEYYVTPQQKKEVTMYINPEKLSMSTAKVKGKAYTRGGIYYNHYGDDHWTLSLHGTVGWSQMRGIEALEEIYHNSGTLLKYQNVNASTVHTNGMGIAQENQMLLDNLRNSNNPILSFLGESIGTVTDFIGLTGTGENSLIGMLGGGRPSNAANANILNATVGAAGNLMGDMLQTVGLEGGLAGTIGGVAASVLVGKNTKNIGAQFGSVFNKNTLKSIGTGMAADAAISILTGQTSTIGTQLAMGQVEYGLNNGLNGVLNILNGNINGGSGGIPLPEQATAGNYYNLGTLSANELNNTINSVQSYTKAHTVDHQQAAQSWSDLEDLVTDLYRPRQVFIYFDDRVFIGHFDSFTWDRSAAHPLIYYDLKFTVTRQVILTPTDQMTTNEATVQDMLIGAGVNMLFNGVFGTQSGTQ